MQNLIRCVPAVIFAVAALLLSHALTSGGALKLWRSEQVVNFDQRLMLRRIVSTDRPSDNPDNFVHRFRRHNLGVYHTYQTWTREHNHRLQKGFKLLLLNTIMCSGQTSSIPRRTFHPRSRAGSRGTAQCWRLIWIRMTRHIEVPKKHGRKLNYISYNHIHKTTYIIWNDMMYQSARETEEKAGPCNLVHPRQPRSPPCHRTWAGGVS